MKRLKFVLVGVFLLMPVGVELLSARQEVSEAKVMVEIKVQDSEKMLALEELNFVATADPQPYLISLIKGTTYTIERDPRVTEAVIRKKWGLEEPQDAAFVYRGEKLSIQQEVVGYDFESDGVLEEMSADYPNLGSYELLIEQADSLTATELLPFYEQVESLMNEGYVLTIGEEKIVFPVQVKDLLFEEINGQLMLTFSEEFWDYLLTTAESSFYLAPDHLRILSVNLEESDYAEIEGDLIDGRQLLVEGTRHQIQDSLLMGGTTGDAALGVIFAEIFDETGLNLGDFDQLGVGRSYFELSTPGRDFNIRKALGKYNGIFVPKGAEVSYNKFLGEMGGHYGWKMAYVIFGGELISQPGGGVCQVSTTMYRSVLNAGLEVVEQRGHSLYVTYYQEYGDGQDATIYPGEQDFVFRNNTPGPLLIVSYDDGYDAYIEIYGTDDGRVVTLEGPYTTTNQTEEVVEEFGSLFKNQIAWKQIIEWSDGTVDEKWLLSSYRGG